MEKSKLKAKPKRKRKPKFSKGKLEMDYLFHSTKQEAFWSELLSQSISMDIERVEKHSHKAYVV